ncbi:hypothetical protein O181_052229 [Austropuccinia psidii MF-1]|uniref:DUF8040 domain-containing protein n=1 Tax=Austropuccinia psidii MF-1 TaxID=1389203 RepID=A0A9Q3HRG4_9BASI|nr:hypothetical protein [Austropuccinia psidii MF-1]
MSYYLTKHQKFLLISLYFMLACIVILELEEHQPFHTGFLRGNDYVQDLLAAPPDRFLQVLRIRKEIFLELIDELQEKGLSNNSKYIRATEKMMHFLYIISNGQSTQQAGEHSQRGQETIYKSFHGVVEAPCSLNPEYFTQPTGNMIPKVISQDDKYSPFCHCIGVIDGTFIPAKVLLRDQGPWRSRKGIISQNVLMGVNFDMSISYVCVGWVGSTHDSRALTNALNNNFFSHPIATTWLMQDTHLQEHS